MISDISASKLILYICTIARGRMLKPRKQESDYKP